MGDKGEVIRGSRSDGAGNSDGVDRVGIVCFWLSVHQADLD